MKYSALMLAVALAFSGVADAKGGFSGGGRSSGGFSSGGRSMSSAPSRPSGPPAAPSPSPNKGGFNSAQRPPPPAAPPPQPPRTATTTTTTSTTMTRRTAGGGYMGGGMMYGGMGMGYGYTNGLLTGLIIGNMMHPHNTVVYSGGGYNGNALLYPDGRVVNQQGYQVGTYNNGQYSAVNGGMVAQAAPADALQYQNSQVAQPVIIQKTGPSTGEIVGSVILGIFCVFLLFVIFL